MDIQPGFGGNSSWDPLNRSNLGQCSEIRGHSEWGPKLHSWQHPIFGIEMGLVFLLLVVQRVFGYSGDYLQLDVMELIDRVSVRVSRFSSQTFVGVKRTLASVMFVTLFLSWAFGKMSGLLVPTIPDVAFGIDFSAFRHPKELKPEDVLPSNSWSTAVWLFFLHFFSPGMSEAMFFHALLIRLPELPKDSPLLDAGPQEAEASAGAQQNSGFGAQLSTRREAYVRDVQLALRQHGASRPRFREYILSFIVYVLFHYDMWHSNPIERDGRYLVIAMGVWLVCQELVIFTQSIWPAVFLRWICTWSWVVFFGGGCYFWQGMFAGVGA